MVDAAHSLRQAGVEQPWFEAQLLLAHAAGLDIAGLSAHDDEFLCPDQQKLYNSYVEQRVKRKPQAYITGKKYFLDWEFYVNEDVLIPRPETELLVQLAVRELKSRFGDSVQIADIGTGSGAIGLSILAMLPSAQLSAVDLSQAALRVARLNAEHLGVQDRTEFLWGDLLEPLESRRGKLHCLTANLPYIASADYQGLEPEIAYEPRNALVSGIDGLDHYRSLLAQARHFLLPEGLAFVEIGSTQGEEVKKLFVLGGFRHPRVERDLAGHSRIVWAVRD